MLRPAFVCIGADSGNSVDLADSTFSVTVS